MIDFSNRISPARIESLNDNEIFVFGSNIEGIHGAGAAKDALKFGAKLYYGEGIYGNTYAIPTVTLKEWLKSNKSENYTNEKKERRKLTLDQISKNVQEFIKYAVNNKDKIFLVTEIGCGLAGYTVDQIAPLFEESITADNIHLPKVFWEYLKK